MNETPSTTRPSGSRTVTTAVVVVFASLVLLLIGGLVKSLALIGVSALGVLCGIAGVWRQDPAGILGIHLPATVGISFVTGGVYLDTALLWFGGFLLLGAHGVWRLTRTAGHSAAEGGTDD